VDRTAGLAQGIADFLCVMLGVSAPAEIVDLEPLAEVAKLMRLDRARRDRIPGVTEPWLSVQPATALLEVAVGLRPHRLELLIDEASTGELEAARRAATIVAPAFAGFADLAEGAGRPGFGGIGYRPVSVSSEAVRLFVALAALAFPAGRADLVAGLPTDPHSG
jgi:hypothetical protein